MVGLRNKSFSHIRFDIKLELICDTWKGLCRLMAYNRHDSINPNFNKDQVNSIEKCTLKLLNP